MTVEQLIAELSRFPSNYEVRIVDREAGYDAPIYMVENEIYGLDPEQQVGICTN